MVVTGWLIVPASAGDGWRGAHCRNRKRRPGDGILISGAGSQGLGDLDCTLLGRFAPIRDLLLCAKHLFVAAITVWAR